MNAELSELMKGRWGIEHRTYAWQQCRYCGAAGNDHPPAKCLACGSIQCQRDSRCSICLYGVVSGFSLGYPRPVCGYAHCGKEPIARAPRVRWVCTDHLSRPSLTIAGQRISLTDYIGQRVDERNGTRRSPYPRIARFIWMS